MGTSYLETLHELVILESRAVSAMNNNPSSQYPKFSPCALKGLCENWHIFSPRQKRMYESWLVNAGIITGYDDVFKPAQWVDVETYLIPKTAKQWNGAVWVQYTGTLSCIY